MHQIFIITLKLLVIYKHFKIIIFDNLYYTLLIKSFQISVKDLSDRLILQIYRLFHMHDVHLKCIKDSLKIIVINQKIIAVTWYIYQWFTIPLINWRTYWQDKILDRFSVILCKNPWNLIFNSEGAKELVLCNYIYISIFIFLNMTIRLEDLIQSLYTCIVYFAFSGSEFDQISPLKRSLLEWFFMHVSNFEKFFGLEFSKNFWVKS